MILGIVEHHQGKLNKATLEMFALAAPLGDVEAVVFGETGRVLATGLGEYGISKVHFFSGTQLDDFVPEAWGKCIANLIEKLSPTAVVASGTETGNDLMAHVGARLNLPMASNCISARLDGNLYLITRMRWGGSLLEEARLAGATKLFTTALHAVAPKSSEFTEATVEEHQVALGTDDFRVGVSERIEDTGGGISLTEARVIVSGGRGVGSQDGFASLEQLAQLIGGAVGCSRAVTNNGWRPHSDQVGQTGARVSPDLYIACGISGAIQHLVGCKGAKKILAINTDPEAPLVSKADYAVIADLHEIVPAISAEIENT